MEAQAIEAHLESVGPDFEVARPEGEVHVTEEPIFIALAFGFAELIEDGAGEEDAVCDGEGSGGRGGVVDEAGGLLIVANG